MRWAVLVLVAANIGFWVWSQGAAQAREGQSDAVRITNQVRPQAISVEPLTAADTASSAASSN